MPFSDGFYCTLKLSCYSLKVHKSSVPVLYTMERTKWKMIIAPFGQKTVQ